MDELTERGAIRAVFEDLGGYGALAPQQGSGSEGPLVGHLQRTNIQLAAIGVFARKGLEQVTVNDLLEAAQVSRRTFYKYFANKMDVLEGIYQTSVQLLLARFRQMQQVAGSPQAWLRAMVGLFFDYHLAVGPIIRLMQEEALRADSPLAAHRQRAHQEMLRLVVERLEPELTPRDPLVYQALIWALEAASLDLLGRSASREQIEQAKAVLGDLLIASLCPGST
ncbi:TetR/AcrR family transcriptional regulator [Ectopseudomonas hydrolytica]|uniref:TetR/AcrR family transcriptional regulator n=1 Tax=Ectopseudomonas hydrolytica TaxID=2493633 RepID=A0ABY5A549_9GAMM|nr:MULTISPECIES: TetR/AcrR family transcriptional regulator [Pseudomonas]ARS50465.1 TetR family transcriptional regulator [Pseudomonas mendocina]EJO95668.1 TetR family transcriptional regulator [Pseudomonas mendocina DLHK]MBA4244648.1 acrEF/envCD operon transcriptional regulator [Pseudomonas sp.]MDH0095102.1 TetR/AcrR family transcriptional regulator [Pseudomonas sp. GD04158]USR38999.1 TetR/AcrR family transcriptional regulator [Pseudomonas hydrolytica]